eukprot:3402252-Pleurochrysis_carterae.AAC.1
MTFAKVAPLVTRTTIQARCDFPFLFLPHSSPRFLKLPKTDAVSFPPSYLCCWSVPFLSSPHFRSLWSSAVHWRTVSPACARAVLKGRVGLGVLRRVRALEAAAASAAAARAA